MNPLNSLVTKLGASTGALAKTTLLAAAVVGGTLLGGGEAKAQNLIFCDIGGDSTNLCPTVNNGDGWILGDKKLSWDSLPIIDGFEQPETPPNAGDFKGQIQFQYLPIQQDWVVRLDFVPPGASEFGGSVNNTDPTGEGQQIGREPRPINDAAWDYVLEIIDSADPTVTFRTAELDQDVNVTENGYFDVVKDIVWDSQTVALNTNEGQESDQAAIGGRKLAVTLDYGTCPDCSFNSISDTYNQTHVPGPLPVLGAAAAFGYSRRLRSRIRLHRPEARIEA